MSKALQEMTSDEDISCRCCDLKHVVWVAKREWADCYISTANIWEVVA